MNFLLLNGGIQFNLAKEACLWGASISVLNTKPYTLNPTSPKKRAFGRASISVLSPDAMIASTCEPEDNVSRSQRRE